MNRLTWSPAKWNNQQLLQDDKMKDLGMKLEIRIIWMDIWEKIYWLLGRKSQLTLQLIWRYGIHLWVISTKFNITIEQRSLCHQTNCLLSFRINCRILEDWKNNKYTNLSQFNRTLSSDLLIIFCVILKISFGFWKFFSIFHLYFTQQLMRVKETKAIRGRQKPL